MKKFILILFFIFIILIICNSTQIINNIILSFNICFNNLFPSLIPFMLLSNILIKFNFVEELSNMFKFITNKVFRVNESCAFALIMSLISGTPSNSKYLKDLYDNNLISIYDIKKCLNFCHFINPIFMIGTIGFVFLNNKKLGVILLIAQYLSSFIIGIIFRNNFNEGKIEKKREKKNNNEKFISILNESIINTSNTLLLILGIITFCLIITAIIDNIFNIDNNYKYIYGLLEITQGLKYLSQSNLSLYAKTLISSFIISFGGLCVHLQVFSILDNKKIRYLPYLFSRILHAIISSIITYIIIALLN